MPAGRPKKQIDKENFEKLCGLQCTIEEFCAFFDVTDKTLSGWCQDTYGMKFSEIFSIKRGIGKISLRRNQFNLAQKNAAMAIFLGKQYLGQKDIVVSDINIEDLRPLAEMLKDDSDTDDSMEEVQPET